MTRIKGCTYYSNHAIKLQSCVGDLLFASTGEVDCCSGIKTLLDSGQCSAVDTGHPSPRARFIYGRVPYDDARQPKITNDAVLNVVPGTPPYSSKTRRDSVWTIIIMKLKVLIVPLPINRLKLLWVDCVSVDCK